MSKQYIAINDRGDYLTKQAKSDADAVVWFNLQISEEERKEYGWELYHDNENETPMDTDIKNYL